MLTESMVDIQVRAFLQPPMQGVVLETYGSGNAPDNRPDLLAELKKATDAGVIIINITQCLRGTVSASYATGKVSHLSPLLLCRRFFSLTLYCSFFIGVDGCWSDCRWGHDSRGCSVKAVICPGQERSQFRCKEKGSPLTPGSFDVSVRVECGTFVSVCDTVQLMAQNLRGEMSLDFEGTNLCLSDSRFIQVIAKSLSISCKEVSPTKVAPF